MCWSCLEPPTASTRFNFFDFEVDPYYTERRGIAEFEGTVSTVPDGQPVEGDSGAVATQWLTRASLELDYGVTDSLDAGLPAGSGVVGLRIDTVRGIAVPLAGELVR